MVPEDLDWTSNESCLKEDSVSFVYGNQDQFIKEGQIENYKAFLDQQGLSHIKFKCFDGVHRVDKEVFKALVADFIE